MNSSIRSGLVLALLFGSAFVLSSGTAWAGNVHAPTVTLPAGLPNLGIGTNGKIIVGSVTEGQSLTITGITIASPSGNTTYPLTYSWIFGFDSGDSTDVITGITQPSGTCSQSLSLAANASCTLNLTFSTPNEIDTGDFGISYITLTAWLAGTSPTTSTFDIQVTDAPEPVSLALLSPGLLALGMIRRRKGAV